jgi:ABC-type bacteriocin/lantibiotic exporter with double-glycine peptidase domain
MKKEYRINLKSWRSYLKYFRGYFPLLTASIFLSAVQAVPIIGITYLIREAFDEAISQNDLRLLIYYGIFLIGLSILTAGITLWSRFITIKATKSAIHRFSADLLTRCYTYSRSYYSQADLGRLHSSIVQDTRRLDSLSYVLISVMLPAFVTSFAICMMLAFYNWILFLILAFFLPLIILTSRPTGKRIREVTKEYNRSYDTFSKGMLFVLQMMDFTRIQAAEDYEIDRQNKYLKTVEKTGGKTIWLSNVYSLLQNTLVIIAGMVIMVVGGIFVINNNLSIGELISFFFGVSILRRYQGNISAAFPILISGNQSLETLLDVIRVKDRRPYTGQKQISFKGKIEFQEVTFQYTNVPLIRDVSFAINIGDTVALIGPNGSGKSTVVNLLLGFYRPDSGIVKADGIPLDELDIVNLRKQIGVVTQKPFQFSGTIRDNITYGFKEIENEQVDQAVKLAMLNDFLTDLPQGLDTIIGEDGVLLSGGQRQKIALARAVLRQPTFLILDEPTSHLDRDAIQNLITSLSRLPNAPTMLLISHDRMIVDFCKHVFELRNHNILLSSTSPAKRKI